MSWTLEYSGTEKTLSAWGIVDDLPFEFNSQAKSLVDIITTDDFDDAFQWAYDSKIIIRRDRTGSGTVWAGGSRWFQGYVAEPRRLAIGGRENHRYTLYDWWWLAERTPFRRMRKSFTGDLVTFLELPPSEVILFENQLEQPIDQTVQFLELLNFLNECWNSTRRGATSGQNPTLDVVVDGFIECDLQCPRYPIRDTMVSEAIHTMLAWTQDAIIETDYDADIPIVSVRRRANMPTVAVTLPSDRAAALQLKPRYDLVIPGVILFWKKMHVQDGVPGLQYLPERYPVDLSYYHPNARVHTIELVGSMQNTVRQMLRTVQVDADSLTAVTQHTWWKKKLAWMDNSNIPQATFTIANVTVTDKFTGAAVDLDDYRYEVVDGAVTRWMEIGAKLVNIKANATYTVNTGSGAGISISQKAKQREISTDIVVCDYDTDGEEELFSTVAQNDPGEVVVFGLAQAIYETHNQLQHEGVVSLVDDDVPATPHLGQLLTINTPGGAYTDNLIQRITGELTRGRLDVHIGPPSHLGLADMIELMRVNRYRTVFNLPSHANDPLLQGGAAIELGEKTPKQDSTEGGGTRPDISATNDWSA